MKKILLVLTVFAGIICTSCKGDDGDTSNPTVSITAPTDNQVYTNGQTVNIRGVLNDNDLHEGKVVITNDAGGAVLNTVYLSIHGMSSYNVNENWVAVASVVTHATVTLEAGDYTGNKGQKKVQITINP